MRADVLFSMMLLAVSAVAQSDDSTRYVLGKVEYQSRPEFIGIPLGAANREGMYLRKEALTAFLEMRKAAASDNIALVIISAARNFNHQKQIWEAKWNGRRVVDGQDLSETVPDAAQRARIILRYSSMPGTSRHHWGTDIDINSLNPNYFVSRKGKDVYEWLQNNARRFGFCQVYSEKDSGRTQGYEEEKWHWSYVPIAARLTRYYQRHVGSTDIQGFDGADALPFSEIMKYVSGIASECEGPYSPSVGK